MPLNRSGQMAGIRTRSRSLHADPGGTLARPLLFETIHTLFQIAPVVRGRLQLRDLLDQPGEVLEANNRPTNLPVQQRDILPRAA